MKYIKTRKVFINLEEQREVWTLGIFQISAHCKDFFPYNKVYYTYKAYSILSNIYKEKKNMKKFKYEPISEEYVDAWIKVQYFILNNFGTSRYFMGINKKNKYMNLLNLFVDLKLKENLNELE